MTQMETQIYADHKHISSGGSHSEPYRRFASALGFGHSLRIGH